MSDIHQITLKNLKHLIRLMENGDSLVTNIRASLDVCVADLTEYRAEISAVAGVDMQGFLNFLKNDPIGKRELDDWIKASPRRVKWWEENGVTVESLQLAFDTIASRNPILTQTTLKRMLDALGAEVKHGTADEARIQYVESMLQFYMDAYNAAKMNTGLTTAEYRRIHQKKLLSFYEPDSTDHFDSNTMKRLIERREAAYGRGSLNVLVRGLKDEYKILYKALVE
jgi:hypothetical protein